MKISYPILFSSINLIKDKSLDLGRGLLDSEWGGADGGGRGTLHYAPWLPCSCFVQGAGRLRPTPPPSAPALVQLACILTYKPGPITSWCCHPLQLYRARRTSAPARYKYGSSQTTVSPYPTPSPHPAASRPASWSKIPAVLSALAAHDWVFWVDADTLVTNPAMALEELLPAGEHPDLLLTRDMTGGGRGPGRHRGVGCGVAGVWMSLLLTQGTSGGVGAGGNTAWPSAV